MSSRLREVWICVGLVLLAAVVWLPTLNWGLPSRATDAALFGDRKPWTGREILDLLSTPSLPPPQAGERSRAADVDADPILDRSKPVVLNATDAQRAAIVRRYRLMSGQPDEFIQFKALAEMSQRSGWAKLDPRLYQYGGLWIYPVGGLVRGAMAAGLIETPPPGVPAMEFYLDHPEAFGRFYIVARAYSAFWGFVALLAVYVLARRITQRPVLGALAAIVFLFLPVVRTATHEAKPHLAGAALCLCAVLAASRYVDLGRRRWLLLAGALCGAAMGMVVSMLLSIVVLPTAWWLRRRAVLPLPLARGGRGEWRPSRNARPFADGGSDAPLASPSPQTGAGTRRAALRTLLAAMLAAAVVYAITNPFVLYNAVGHPELLRSNLGNSTAMYGVSELGSMASSAARISLDGLGFLGAIAAFLALYAIFGLRREIQPVTVLLAAIGTAFALQFLLLAGGKPSEYARFGIVVASWFCVCAAAGFQLAYLSTKSEHGGACSIRPGTVRWLIAGAVIVFVLATQFITFARPLPARVGLERVHRQISRPLRIAVAYEPAPWSMPALDLFTDQLVLVPRDQPEMRAAFDAFIYPSNLASQVGERPQREQGDWLKNQFLFAPTHRKLNSTPALPGSDPAG